MFCDAPLFNITRPEAWMERFYNRDGGQADGHAQCKFRSSQRGMFLETMRRRFARRKTKRESDRADMWNEVNFYVGTESYSLRRTLWSNLIGLLLIRPLGRGEDLEQAWNLTAHFRSLGAEIPILTVNVEDPPGIEWWEPSRQVRLQASPYNLREIPLGERLSFCSSCAR
jgi:hypothetical protein